MADDFTWTEEEQDQLHQMSDLLSVDHQVPCDVVKYVLRLLAVHEKEFAVALAKKILTDHGIKCGHHGKANESISTTAHLRFGNSGVDGSGWRPDFVAGGRRG